MLQRTLWVRDIHVGKSVTRYPSQTHIHSELFIHLQAYDLLGSIGRSADCKRYEYLV